ncbi:hypothetical protein TNCT_42881, partial [Trichonephila clavata]
LEHTVAKPLVVAARLVGFSDTLPAVEEKRGLDDEERMLDVEERIDCFLNNPPGPAYLGNFVVVSPWLYSLLILL